MNDGAEASLESRIAELYGSPLADFIRSRDAVARRLRSAGDRDAASAIKSLRKPSRPAWALNRVANQAPQSIATLEAAVADISNAHGGSGDVRVAMAALRGAVRDHAARAAEECRNEGFSLGVGDLSNAILAVLGDPSSYADFRSGRLADIPPAGGLGLLTSLPARPRLEVSAPLSSTSSHDPAEAAAVRKRARLAAKAVEAARGAADVAAAALSETESEFVAAQDRVRLAESDLRAAQQRREFARRTKESASAELREAEVASQEAERRLESVERGQD